MISRVKQAQPERFGLLLSGTDDSRRASRESIRANHSQLKPLFHRRFATRFARIDSHESFAIETPIFIARRADLPESREYPIRANHGH